MRRKLPLVALLAALLLLPLAAVAAERPNGPGPANPASILENPRALARYLRLTPTQIEQQKALLADLREEVEPLREQQKPLAESLRAKLEAANPAACDVGALLVDIDELGDQIRDARGDYEAAFVALLTPAQKARYDALKALIDALHEESAEG